MKRIFKPIMVDTLTYTRIKELAEFNENTMAGYIRELAKKEYLELPKAVNDGTAKR